MSYAKFQHNLGYKNTERVGVKNFHTESYDDSYQLANTTAKHIKRTVTDRANEKVSAPFNVIKAEKKRITEKFARMGI